MLGGAAEVLPHDLAGLLHVVSPNGVDEPAVFLGAQMPHFGGTLLRPLK